MTDFFDNLGGGGAPGAKLKEINDWVQGTIVDSYKRDYIPFGKKDPEKNKDGVTNRQQLVVILQTEHRNWENVNKIPLVDHNDPSKGPKPPTEDDGRRAVFVTERSNLQYAVGDAITAARSQNPAAKFDNGGFLQIKIFNLKPTENGSPMKEHTVRYTPPSAAGGFFPSQEAAPAAPQAQAAPPVQQAPAQPAAPAAPQAPAAPAQDPWATPAPAAPAQDPFGGAAAGTAGNNPPPF